MKIPMPIKVFLKSAILMLIAVFCLNKYNFFEYITFIPKDHLYETGLTVYLSVVEAIYAVVVSKTKKNEAKIRCIFYISEINKDIKNTPVIICDENMGVATISCHLELSGNVKKLRKSKLCLKLPEWLTSQANASDVVLEYFQNCLSWEFDRMLPETGFNGQIAECKNKISFIRNVADNNMSIELKPQIEKKCGVKLETNSIIIRNGE